jgi:hypothetical protein
MSSIYHEMGTGPWMLKWHSQLGAKPFLVTAALLTLLECPEEDRPKNFIDTLKKDWAEFTSVQQRVALFVHNHGWKTTRWNRTRKSFFTLRCGPCTIDEAVADYLRYLPPALVATAAVAKYLTREEIEQAESAYELLDRRVKALLNAPAS